MMAGSRVYSFMPTGKQPKDITGHRCGRLVAIRLTAERRGGSVVWECLCDCGNIKYATQGSLSRGTPKSCGCLARPLPPINIKHGMFGHPLYKTWEGMMARCYSENSKDFYLYGGRGTGVCERWHDPKSFAEDLTSSPP